MTQCLLGLGSNLGDRQQTLRQATSRVANLDGCQLIAHSRWHETAPIGGPSGQGAFLNGALLIDCSIPPHELAKALQAIETQLGRARAIRWDARAIDIDLLLYGSERVETADLTIPHPRMSFRKFVLEPAAEIAGFMVEPVSGWTLTALLSHLQNAARYVAVTSPSPEIATWLANQLCQVLGCQLLEISSTDTPDAGDSNRPGVVESSERRIAALRRSHWARDQELLQRLTPGHDNSLPTVPPVVSDFWLAPATSVPMPRGKPPENNPAGSNDVLSPALVIAVTPSSEKKFWEKNKTKKQPVLPKSPPSPSPELQQRNSHGPMARIQADDPAIVLQEAIAAIRSIWPELAMLSEEM